MALLLIAPDADRLDSTDYRTREGAESRLRGWGFFAVPWVLPVTASESPEARARAARLLAPWNGWCADMRAAALLAGPLPDEAALIGRVFDDHQMRLRLYRLALAAGCGDRAEHLHPQGDAWNWFLSLHATARFLAALHDCREQVWRRRGSPGSHGEGRRRSCLFLLEGSAPPARSASS